MGGCTPHPDARAWRMGAIASLLIHAAIGAAVPFVAVGTADGRSHQPRGERPTLLMEWLPPPPVPPEEPRVQAPPPEPEFVPEPVEPQITLGIEDSTSLNGTALGFEEPTPHQAERSSVEQAGLDPAAGAPGAQAPVAGPPPQPASPPQTPVESSIAEPEERPAQEEVRPERSVVASPVSDQGERPPGVIEETPDPRPEPERPLPGETTDATPAAATEPGDSAEEASERVEPAPAPTPEPTPADPVRPSEPDLLIGPPAPEAPAEPAASETAPSPGAGEKPGEVSEKEADPTALTEPIEIRPGRPKAAAGLEIITKRPIFSKVVRALALPDNPVLKVTFDRSGRVRHAKIVKTSGIEDVDGPVLAAVYKWSAKGKPLRELPADDPKAGITMTVTILLR